MTQVPGFYPLNDDVFLVDAPGFGDSNTYLEFPNQTLIHEVIKNANKVVICVVLKGSNIDSQRGSGYLGLMTSVLRLMTPGKAA